MNNFNNVHPGRTLLAHRDLLAEMRTELTPSDMVGGKELGGMAGEMGG